MTLTRARASLGLCGPNLTTRLYRTGLVARLRRAILIALSGPDLIAGLNGPGFAGAILAAILAADWCGPSHPIRKLICRGTLDALVRHEGARRDDRRGTAFVLVEELLLVLGGVAYVVPLRGHGRQSGTTPGGHLSRLRPCSNTARTTVEGCAVATIVDYDRMVVDVGDAATANIVDAAVVVEVIAVPVAAAVTGPEVAEAVVDAAVEADMRAPVAAAVAIAVAKEEPVAGGPERAGVGRSDPGAGNPVVAAERRVVPVAGGPEIVGVRCRRLVVDGKLGWCVGSLKGGLAGVNELLVVISAAFIALGCLLRGVLVG